MLQIRGSVSRCVCVIHGGDALYVVGVHRNVTGFLVATGQDHCEWSHDVAGFPTIHLIDLAASLKGDIQYKRIKTLKKFAALPTDSKLQLVTSPEPENCDIFRETGERVRRQVATHFGYSPSLAAWFFNLNVHRETSTEVYCGPKGGRYLANIRHSYYPGSEGRPARLQWIAGAAVIRDDSQMFYVGEAKVDYSLMRFTSADSDAVAAYTSPTWHRVTSFDVHPSGDIIAICVARIASIETGTVYDGVVYLHRLHASGELGEQLAAFKITADHCCFSPDGLTLVTVATGTTKRETAMHIIDME